jgi:hypothetical protein
VLRGYARLRELMARKDGQGLVEYALILVQAAFQDIVSSLGG